VPTKTVAFNGREAGGSTTESKQTTIAYSNDPNTIVKVEFNNSYPKWSSGAVIENLIIDGYINSSSVAGTGILLENVCNCLIRNLTIKNCDVGIHVKLTNGESFANRFEHIHMFNVKTGIKFTGITGTEGAKNFHYTTIDDVGISLKDDMSAIGIQIGDTNTNNAKLYSTFIKANVLLGSSNCKGLEVNGELKYSLVNLDVEQPVVQSWVPTGWGVFVNSGAVVSDNQSFLLSTLRLDSSSRIKNNGGTCTGITQCPR